jgi:hypothetical protein
MVSVCVQFETRHPWGSTRALPVGIGKTDANA